MSGKRPVHYFNQLGGAFWNEHLDWSLQEMAEIKAELLSDMTEGGTVAPPFNAPLPEEKQHELLRQGRDTQAPWFMGSARAQHDLERLEAKAAQAQQPEAGYVPQELGF